MDKVKVKGDSIKGFVIAATGSGTGKTTITLAILAWLANQGIRVAPFKVGPDFIDPGIHAKIAGRASYNLDSWMLPRAYNQALFAEKSRDVDLAVVEGVMGLFDGYDAQSETGSTAQMAKWLGLPVVLVVSAKGKARSAAAIVKGFETFDPDLNLAGVIFARAGSERHYLYLKQAVEMHCTTPCLGYLPKDDRIVMPERHLGLVTADELVLGADTLSVLVSMIDRYVDMKGLMQGLTDIPGPMHPQPKGRIGEPDAGALDGPVIGVARDKAFCFYYPDNIELLEQSGARIRYFSPMVDDALPPDLDGLYFGGGYPELNAGCLAEKKRLMAEIRELSRAGMPIYGECGGFMYLCREVSDAEGTGNFSMCGIFDFSVQMSGRLRSLGYREVTLASDTLLGRKGEVIRGHEFHYSAIRPDNLSKSSEKRVYKVTSRAGQDISLQGFQLNQTLGSYLHVHFGSNPGAARHFSERCREYRRQRLAWGSGR